QRGRLAERGDAAEPDLPLLAELLHGGHDFAEHVAEAQGTGAARELDPVVELKQIDAVQTEPTQARVERAGARPGDGLQIARTEAEFRADMHPRAERLQHLPEVPLGLAVTVGRRRVEVVDTELHGPGDTALSLCRRPPDNQPADIAASEPERRHRQTRLAQTSRFHGSSLSGD